MRFLDAYSQLIDGRTGAVAASPVTPELRRQLADARDQITPIEPRRHPHAVSLQLLVTTPGFVVATATMTDGGIAAYRLRFTLESEAGRWVVSSVGEG